MKISFFIGSMQRGGAERVISILANDYCCRGWDVDIVLLLNNKVEYELNDRIRIVDLSGPGSGYIKNAAYWLTNIRCYLKKQKPDKVVSFVARINALVLTAALGLRLHIVISERNDPNQDGRGAVMQKYCNKIYQRANKIVFQNKYQQTCFSSKLLGKSAIIPNPIQVKKEALEQRSHRIVTVGKLMHQKNQKMLINAFSAVYKKHPEYILDIYGEGVLRNELQQQIDSLGLTEVVTLRGNVLDIHEQIADAEIFVLPSDFEGLSNALLEAMMMGFPCVAANYPGCDEVICDGKNGLLVPVGNQGELEKSLEKLISDPELAARLGKTAKEDSVQFAVATVIEKWREAIEG